MKPEDACFLRCFYQNIEGSSLGSDRISQIDFPITEFFECLIFYKQIDVPGAGGGGALVILMPFSEPFLDLSSWGDCKKGSSDWIKYVGFQTFENEFPGLVCGQTDHVSVDPVINIDGVAQDFQIINLEGINIQDGFSFTEFDQIGIVKQEAIDLDLILKEIGSEGIIR